MSHISGGSPHNGFLEQATNNKSANPANEIKKALYTEKASSSLLPNDKSFDTQAYKPSNISTKIFEIFSDPKGIVDDIRNASDANAKNKGLIEFQSKIDKMSSKDLTVTRDYIIEQMEDPTNTDDKLLFLLLKTVNKRLDSEHINPGRPIHPLVNPHPNDLEGSKIMFD